MKPYVICHMITSLDGRLHASRWSKSPDGNRAEWSGVYQEVHEALESDAWIVGRVTMAEMTNVGAHAPTGPVEVDRPHYFAMRDAGGFAIALDPMGKLHFKKSEIGGDHLVILLGRDVPDKHLAELAADGISYVVAENAQVDLAAILDTLNRELGITRLLLEGGAAINRSFFNAGLVDELSLLVAPAIDGRSDSLAAIGTDSIGLAEKVRLSLTSCQVLNHGIVHLRYTIARPS